ncbi:hypothetical protein V8G54_013192 [Vigna mungo]|uniref:tRNA(Ile)-lysidine synthetase n=1 Tax=Vigna mungo TaxID=3915 RepID=A0AAQ3NSI9_VIGMU
MGRGLIPSSPTTLTGLFASISKTPPKSFNLSFGFKLVHHKYRHLLPLACCFSVSSSTSSPSQCSVDISKYTEAFSRRMAMAGLKPHHRIALGVSGGPDSMALCVLTAEWKTAGANVVTTENGGLIDGLLAIIVDHGLRAESKEEANVVSQRVSKMGSLYKRGRPKQGHLQEAAREMRYKIFQEVCAQHQIGVLLIAHHADDQNYISTIEVAIKELPKRPPIRQAMTDHSMPFTSQIFPTHTHSEEVQVNQGILLVRPLLEFSKEDMYKICQGGSEDWVEDPTNQSPLYARNRIRMHGYAVIDLQILCSLKIEDICLMKFLSLVLQFVSQRQRQVRGSAMKLLMDYIRTFPCKNSITIAGCYLCPDPGSRGSRLLVCCCSDDCALPLKMEFFKSLSHGPEVHCVANELEKIIEDVHSFANHFLPDSSDVHFLDVNPTLILTEAKMLNIISESTYNNILALQKQETAYFRSTTETISDSASKHGVETVAPFRKSLQPGQFYYFMNRFILSWSLKNKIDEDELSGLVDYEMDLSEEARSFCCTCCVVGHNKALEVRQMIESDWLYMAELSKYPLSKNSIQYDNKSVNETKQIMYRTSPCLHYASVSAKQALHKLKSIPVAARRSLPILITEHGQLQSIPQNRDNTKDRDCKNVLVIANFMSTKRDTPKWNDQYPSWGHQPPSVLPNQVLLSLMDLTQIELEESRSLANGYGSV